MRWRVVGGFPPGGFRRCVDVWYGSNGGGLVAESKDGMQLFAPVVRQDKQVCFISRQVVHSLAIYPVCSVGIVAGLGVAEFLDRGVNDGGKEDGLDADKRVTSLRSGKSAIEVPLGMLRNELGKVLRGQLPSLHDIQELGVCRVLFGPPQGARQENLNRSNDDEVVDQ